MRGGTGVEAYDVSESSEQSQALLLQKEHGTLFSSITASSTTVDEESSSSAVTAERLYTGEAPSESLESVSKHDDSRLPEAVLARSPPRFRRLDFRARPLAVVACSAVTGRLQEVTAATTGSCCAAS